MISWIKKELKEGKTLISYSMIGIGSNGLTFLVPIVLAMLFKPEVFGIYSLGMMIVYFFNSSLILSSGKPSVVYGRSELTATQKISNTVTARIILLSISLVIIVLIIVLGFKNMGWTRMEFLIKYWRFYLGILLPSLIVIVMERFK